MDEILEPTETQPEYAKDTHGAFNKENFSKEHYSNYITEYKNQLYNETVNKSTDFIFWR